MAALLLAPNFQLGFGQIVLCLVNSCYIWPNFQLGFGQLVGLTNCRAHRHNVPVTKALNRDILAAEKERKKRRKEEEEEVPYMV